MIDASFVAIRRTGESPVFVTVLPLTSALRRVGDGVDRTRPRAGDRQAAGLPAATLPAAATVTARMDAVSRASNATPAPAETVAAVMSASTVLTIVLTAMPAPTDPASPPACPPATATATEPAAASMVEWSWACSATAPERTADGLRVGDRGADGVGDDIGRAGPRAGEGGPAALTARAGRPNPATVSDEDVRVLVGLQGDAVAGRHGGAVDERLDAVDDDIGGRRHADGDADAAGLPAGDGDAAEPAAAMTLEVSSAVRVARRRRRR